MNCSKDIIAENTMQKSISCSCEYLVKYYLNKMHSITKDKQRKTSFNYNSGTKFEFPHLFPGSSDICLFTRIYKNYSNPCSAHISPSCAPFLAFSPEFFTECLQQQI